MTLNFENFEIFKIFELKNFVTVLFSMAQY